METLGQRLKHVRQSLSQQAVADKLGIPQTTWGNYERDRCQPDLALLDKVCAVFAVKAEWLLFGRGPVHDVEKVNIVRATTGGSFPLRCGEPPTRVDLKPEYQAELDRIAALEARVVELEKERDEARAAESKAKDEVIKAYKLVVEAMRPASAVPLPVVNDEDEKPQQSMTAQKLAGCFNQKPFPPGEQPQTEK